MDWRCVSTCMSWKWATGILSRDLDHSRQFEAKQSINGSADYYGRRSRSLLLGPLYIRLAGPGMRASQRHAAWKVGANHRLHNSDWVASLAQFHHKLSGIGRHPAAPRPRRKGWFRSLHHQNLAPQTYSPLLPRPGSLFVFAPRRLSPTSSGAPWPCCRRRRGA